jgi:ABC-2 type transport system permease protein
VHLAVSASWLGWLALNLVASTVIVLSVQFICGSLAFWAPRGAEEINTSTWTLLDQLMPFPLDHLGPLVLGGLLTVVPIGLLAWYPVRALLGLTASGVAVAVTPLAAVVAGTLAVCVFRRGLQHYGRTGSQRYLSLGHRG